MAVLEMKLSDDLAEAVGQVAINAAIEGGHYRVEDASSPPIEGEGHVIIWTANAAEQIGATIMERFDVRGVKCGNDSL